MMISDRIPPNLSTYDTIERTYFFAKKMIDIGVDGDFVECGIAAGNNLAAMCAAGRHGYGFDSFEGIPWAGENDDQQPGIGDIPSKQEGVSSGISSYPIESVEENFLKWDISNYTLIQGWFSDTIPNQKAVKKISILRLDGDLYESTIVPLVHLYPLLSKGGILIIDDWGLSGCRKAVHDYFNNELPKEFLECDGVKYFEK